MAAVKETGTKSSAQASHKEYEAALKLLHKGDPKKALETLEKARTKFKPDSKGASLVETYIRICRAKLRTFRGPSNDSAEDLYDWGVYHHNEGEHQKALELFEKALGVSKEQSFIHYAMAASQALLNDTDKAIEHLKQAIEMEETVRFQARNDPDFDGLSEDKRFQELVDSSGSE